MRPRPALVLAAFAAVALAFNASADNRDSRATSAVGGPYYLYLAPSTVDRGLEIVEVTRVLRAAGWPEPHIAEALEVSGCESGWRPAAVGSAGEVGLFQIHPVHAARFNFHGAKLDAADPLHNAYVALRIWSEAGWSPWSCQPGRLAARS